MKVRQGFVSNSSSSSFILAVDKDKVPKKVLVPIEINLLDYQDEIFHSEEAFWIYYKIEVDDNKECFEKQYKEELKELRSGKSIIMCSVCSDGDDAMSCYLHNRGVPEDKLPKNIKYFGDY